MKLKCVYLILALSNLQAILPESLVSHCQLVSLFFSGMLLFNVATVLICLLSWPIILVHF